MSSVLIASSSFVVPKKVTHVGTMFAVFRYPTSMSVGEVVVIKEIFKIHWIGNIYFKFLLKKTSRETVSVICERHVNDEASVPNDESSGSDDKASVSNDEASGSDDKASGLDDEASRPNDEASGSDDESSGSDDESSGSSIVMDALEADDGCFLRMYFSVIGVNEKPKSAILRSTDTSTSVEFTEDSFLNPIVHVGYIYTFKCVIRRIETTVLSNKLGRKQERLWKKWLGEAHDSSRQTEDLDYVLKCSKLKDLLTGRRTRYTLLESLSIFDNVCNCSKELYLYFKALESSKPVPPTIDLGLILGLLIEPKDRIPITVETCITFYRISCYGGLMLVKELCTAFLIENLTDESVIEVIETADCSEDARLFNAAWLFCLKNKLQIFCSDEWKRYVDYRMRARSIVYGFLLRCFNDSSGFPPAMEDESAQP